MFKFLSLLTDLQEKGVKVSKIEVRENDYYIIDFKIYNGLYGFSYCSVSEFAIFCEHSLPNDIREILRVIQF